jgi:cytochrome c-type biogenesis protein CcmE
VGGEVIGKKKFLIGGIIVILALGYLTFMSFQGAATYYYTVSELAAQSDVINGENVRVNGQVVPGSVEQEAGGGVLRFTIVEGEESLLVAYQGVVPDTFQVGNEVVVEGQLTSAGTFQAHTLMPKCPSRYVPQE